MMVISAFATARGARRPAICFVVDDFALKIFGNNSICVGKTSGKLKMKCNSDDSKIHMCSHGE